MLVACGHTAGGKRRVWGIKASPTTKADDYIALLTDLALPAARRTIVSDKDEAIASAVRRMWPAGSPDAPFAFACEHHLRRRAQDALAQDKADAGRGRWMRRQDTAFRRPEGWEEFAAAAGELGVSAAWVANQRGGSGGADLPDQPRYLLGRPYLVVVERQRGLGDPVQSDAAVRREGAARGDNVATRRDLLLVAVVVVVAIGMFVWRSATGAGIGTALAAAASVVFIAAVGVTANQVAARRRARRGRHQPSHD